MEYRSFGNLSFKPSALGFGCMRFPLQAGGPDVDEPAAIEMLRYAIDQGVNYVDTAYPYHNGASERIVGQALRDGYRAKVAVASKMPVWRVQALDDMDRLFAEQLQRLETDRIDFYMFHGLNEGTWKRMREMEAVRWFEKTRKEGKIGQFGFSFHDGFETFQTILNDYDGWAFCQIQYNYMNENEQAGTRGLELAGQRGLAVIVMEPLLGGALASPPEPVRGVFGPADPVDLALRWLWDRPQVSLVLSGMSSLEQVKQNLAIASASGAGRMSAAEKDLIARARQEYEKLHPIGCTQCGYCQPCPKGVKIPVVFRLYDQGHAVGKNLLGLNRALYKQLPEDQRASACAACGECEAKCPQHLKISQWMPRVHEVLAG